MRIIQFLNMDLKKVKAEIPVVKSQGFDAAQITPIQPLKEDSKNIWWLGYQQCGFRIGNQFGSRDDLCDLCSTASEYKVGIFADAVINHTAGGNNGELYPSDKVDPELRNNPYFWKEKRNISNWNDRWQVINLCMGLPGLNPTNWDLQKKIIDFLNDLIACGVSGFRFDAAKSIGLPTENVDFWPRVLYSLSCYGLFLYGEVINQGGDIIKEYSKYFKILTDLDLTNISRDNMIRFVESHDTYNGSKTTYCYPSYVINDWYRGLTNYYPNTVYYARPNDDAWKSNVVRDANKQKVYARN